MKSLVESLFDSKTQMTESLFDKDIISNDVKFGDLYELSFIHMSSPYCFNKLYIKKLISRYEKWSNNKNIDKYWTYYGSDNNYKTPPPKMAEVCNVIIKYIEEFPMYKSNNQSETGWKYSVFIGSNDPLSNGLRSYIHNFIYEYVIGLHRHNIYVDSNYKYRGNSDYVQIWIGKETYRGKYSTPDRIEFVFKKK